MLGYLAGIPTYTLSAELAACLPLYGDIEAVPFPPKLAAAAPQVWRFCRSFSLDYARMHARRGNPAGVAGQAAAAIMEEAHAISCERGQWVCNEKRLIEPAGLSNVNRLFAEIPIERERLLQWVDLVAQEIENWKKVNIMKKSASQTEKTPSQMIDERIKELDDWRGKLLSRLRGLIKQADPTVVEEWKWNVPVWSHDGLICTGETYKKVVKLTFSHGAALDDPSGLFNSSLEGNTRRAIDFHEGEEIDEEALKALIRAAVKLNTVRGHG